VALDVDGTGVVDVSTGVPFYDHMLSQLGKHGGFDLTVTAKGDLEVDLHHTVEDVGIVLGQALREALGDKRGVRRFANALVPLDEALVQVALDLSGRPFLVYDVEPVAEWIGTFDPQLAEEFWKGFVDGARVTLHLRSLSGKNGHHVIEASFKGVARALRDAVKIESDDVPSTKGTLSS
jgi:imidazoleglycerol-phosphate dehydratase